VVKNHSHGFQGSPPKNPIHNLYQYVIQPHNEMFHTHFAGTLPLRVIRTKGTLDLSMSKRLNTSTSFQFQFAGFTLSHHIPISFLKLPSLLVNNTKE